MFKFFWNYMNISIVWSQEGLDMLVHTCMIDVYMVGKWHYFDVHNKWNINSPHPLLLHPITKGWMIAEFVNLQNKMHTIYCLFIAPSLTTRDQLLCFDIAIDLDYHNRIREQNCYLLKQPLSYLILFDTRRWDIKGVKKRN